MRRKQHKPGKSVGEPAPVQCDGSSDTTAPESDATNHDLDTEDDNKDSEDKEDDDLVCPPMEIVPTPENIVAGSNATSECDIDSTSEIEKAPLKLIVRKSRLVSPEKQTRILSPEKQSNGGGMRFGIGSLESYSHAVQHPLPIMPEIFEDSDDTKDSMEVKFATPTPPPVELPLMVENMPKHPYKGTMVPCGRLKEYLDSLPTFNRKCMLRKGREVHKIYVDMTKGETFLDDQFAYTEFGRMVLTNGSIRAGRAKNAKQIVVARETLYCSGTTACKRACGGYGICLTDCDKTKMRGHRCSYRIKLTQRLGFVNFWFVEELGSHDQLNGKDCDFKVNSQIASARIDTDAMDLSQSLKIKLPNIPKSHRKLAPKPHTLPSPEKAHFKTRDQPVSDSSAADVPTSYHYVLGSIPNGSPSVESPAHFSSSQSHAAAPPSSIDAYSLAAASSQHCAIDPYNGLMSAASLQAAGSPVLPGCLQPVNLNSLTPVLQANFVNYMSTMTNLGAALQNGLNPFLVNVKQEPSDDGSPNMLGFSPSMPMLPSHLGFPSPSQHSSRPSSTNHSPSPSRGQGRHSPSPSRGQGRHSPLPSRGQGHHSPSPSSRVQGRHSPSPSRGQSHHSPSPSSRGQGHHSTSPSSRGQVHHSPSPSSRGQGHSPSPIRSHGHHRDRSPLCRDLSRDQSPQQGIQKGLEIEAKIKKEASHKMQAHSNILGQVHNRIMERAKSRKSTHNMRVPQKAEAADVIDLSYKANESVSETSHGETNTNSIMDTSNLPDIAKPREKSQYLSTLAFQRFQTLNHVIRSEVFQNAKNQLERKRNLENGLLASQENGEDSALNLVVNHSKNAAHSDAGNQGYFRLAEDWDHGSDEGEMNEDEERFINSDISPSSIVNGHFGELSEALLDSDKLTQNEKELMCRVRQLEAHVKQLQNIVIKKNISTTEPMAGRRKFKQRQIDFNKYNTRHVALRVMYLGFDYLGFAGYQDADETVEKVLIDTLKKTKLIESLDTACYTRCGRTDKGVSAFCQVISLDLRSNLLSGVGVKVREGGTAHERPDEKTSEIRYCHVLNKNLPKEIRVLAWAPVDTNFSSRFSCKKRTYKYFFPRGELNIELMNEAANHLVGEHDFRNFCKANIADGVTNHMRHILSAGITVADTADSGSTAGGGYTMCELTIVGTAFLWHQIRCIVSVLFLVGRDKEQPTIVEELFDIDKNPGKPQYTYASEIPLCLYDADFGDDFEWIYEADWHEDNIKTLQHLWAEHSVKATMLKSMLQDMDQAKVETECDIAPWSDLSPPLQYQSEWIFPDKLRIYKPLLQRHKDISIEEKILNHEAKRRKLDTDSDNKDEAIDAEDNNTETTNNGTEEAVAREQEETMDSEEQPLESEKRVEESDVEAEVKAEVKTVSETSS